MEKELNNKNEELNKLIKKFGVRNINEKSFNIKFESSIDNINFTIKCNDGDSIVKLEEEVYNKYPQFKEFITYLTCNGFPIKRFKTIKDNNIKENNVILINKYFDKDKESELISNN